MGDQIGLYESWLVNSIFHFSKSSLFDPTYETDCLGGRMLALPWWTMIGPLELAFLMFSKICYKQMVGYNSELTVGRFTSDTTRAVSTCSVFLKKISDHLLGNVSCMKKFCGVWLVLKDPYGPLLFNFTYIGIH